MLISLIYVKLSPKNKSKIFVISYRSQGIGLDQRGLGELGVRGVVGVHPLPGEGLQDGPVVEVVVVGV